MIVYYVYYYPNYYYPMYWPVRYYRQVDAELLHGSAVESKKLMKDASLVLDMLADSKEFDEQLMQAAEQSNEQEVKRLIDSIGVSSKVEVHYNPDGLRLEFSSQLHGVDCCKLLIALRWR
ncbi:hypothetical protein [Halobacillus sp. Marseille-Q1614]|uniref:hypothetical protein n=1 Tax=Halobacillus sp. Marseille-Q1614 TaxID=2709134 RepID=UPI0015710C06|nr:hypothetical protein [Halobacillus sp. Marseille-Q1614]